MLRAEDNMGTRNSSMRGGQGKLALGPFGQGEEGWRAHNIVDQGHSKLEPGTKPSSGDEAIVSSCQQEGLRCSRAACNKAAGWKASASPAESSMRGSRGSQTNWGPSVRRHEPQTPMHTPWRQSCWGDWEIPGHSTPSYENPSLKNHSW